MDLWAIKWWCDLTRTDRLGCEYHNSGCSGKLENAVQRDGLSRQLLLMNNTRRTLVLSAYEHDHLLARATGSGPRATTTNHHWSTSTSLFTASHSNSTRITVRYCHCQPAVRERGGSAVQILSRNWRTTVRCPGGISTCAWPDRPASPSIHHAAIDIRVSRGKPYSVAAIHFCANKFP